MFDVENIYRNQKEESRKNVLMDMPTGFEKSLNFK